MDVVCIQLTNVTRTWWLAKEIRYQEHLTWEKFVEAFHSKFLHALAKLEMRKKFLELQQSDQTTNAYAAEFVRLGHFVPSLVADEEEQAHMF